VLRYVEHKGGRWDDVVAAEVDVSLVRDRYILGGSIDLLQGQDGTVEVVDFKAESKPDLVRDAERVARYRRQLDIYGFLVEKRFGKKVTRLHLHYTGALSGNPRISHDMNPERVGKTIATFDAVVDRIEGQAFSITERPEQLCKNCDSEDLLRPTRMLTMATSKQPTLPLNLPPAAEEPREFFEVTARPDPQRGYPELWWKGKRPFNGVHYYPAQHKESHGPAVDGWRNQLYWGDNLQVMGHLLRKFRGQVDLVYIDPPFDSRADYKKTSANVGGSVLHGDRTPPSRRRQYGGHLAQRRLPPVSCMSDLSLHEGAAFTFRVASLCPLRLCTIGAPITSGASHGRVVRR
jgi:hypothetical protein